MYLDQSIQSALNQTYQNIEVIINDNCSNDKSIEVAMKYIDKGVVINKNTQNIYNFNYDVLYGYARGTYFILLCADDVIQSEFIEKAVNIMEHNSNIGFVHCERNYIDEKGIITELDPFFDCSFMASGEQMLPIFMLTDVGQSAQAVIRRSSFEEVGKHDTESDHLNIDREQWFRLSMVSDYAYIREKLTFIRMPETTSETSRIVETFYHPIALYHTIKSFEKWGELRNYPNVIERVDVALKRLAGECMGFTKVFLSQGKYDLAKQYLLFMKLVNNAVVEDKEYLECQQICQSRQNNGMKVDEFKKSKNYSFRKRNYNPPEGYVLLDEGGYHA